jgi:hypothetical protein
LADNVRSCINDEEQGVILSFPTVHRFARKQFDSAAAYGICVVILWGLFQCCAIVRRKRQEARKKGAPSMSRYQRLNHPTFEMYSRGDYDRFRVWTLDANCAHRPYNEILADIRVYC